MKTIYNLPSNLPQPPAPPEGYRWSICGYGIPEGHIRDGEIAAVLFTDMAWHVHNPVVGNYGSNRNNFYVRAVPLRPTPSDLPPLEPGWEYASKGGLAHYAGSDDLLNVAAFDTYWPGWDYGGWWGDYHENHFALKIGSKVHFENIVSPQKAPIKIPDGGKRDNSDEGIFEAPVIEDPTPEPLVDPVDYYALVAERDTLQFDLTLALHHIETLLGDFANYEHSNVRTFVANFSPPFDWDALWSSLSAWSNWVAMDEDGEWYSFSKKPEPDAGFWGYSNTEHIPEEFAPPSEGDWKESLVERPKNN